ncbi:hypothetical protein LSAT2_022995 [Lamellibrachia satsuma]|nr:hypothetical protein LSAT2_022995 [Lamellibrachia satsuma]
MVEPCLHSKHKSICGRISTPTATIRVRQISRVDKRRRLSLRLDRYVEMSCSGPERGERCRVPMCGVTLSLSADTILTVYTPHGSTLAVWSPISRPTRSRFTVTFYPRPTEWETTTCKCCVTTATHH